MTTKHRKRCKNYNIPGDAHELTFSCFQRLPLLSKDRTRHFLLTRDAVRDMFGIRRRKRLFSSGPVFHCQPRHGG